MRCTRRVSWGTGLRFLALLFSLAVLLGIAACGGGGSSSATIAAVTIACTPTSVQSGQTSQCTATVTGTGTFLTGVTWAASAGAIDTTGLFTAQAVTASTQVTITAISNQDTSKNGTATITVTPVTGIVVSCTPAVIQSLQTSQCNATANGVPTTTVNWTSTIGVVSLSGLFTAPTVSATTQVTVTATTQVTNVPGSAGVTVNVNNSTPLAVDGGPTGVNYPNGAYVTATVCVPGTTNCTAIDHVLVDTGSVGFRVLSSALGSLALTPQNASDGNPMAECFIAPAGYAWGPVALAQVQVSGEIASSIPVEVIAPSNFPAAPAACTGQTTGSALNTIAALKAKGILGIGFWPQDCGASCASAPQSTYFSCPIAGCAPLPAAIAQQVANPVAAFPGDNNGSEIQFPPLAAGGAQTAQGALIFGIGTQPNNGLAAATVYTVSTSSQNPGSFVATYGSTAYFGSISSGADANYFLSPAITGYPACTNPGYYCPGSQQTATVNVAGINGATGTVTLTTDNADNLFKTGFFAFSSLAGPGGNRTSGIVFGMPFFYGRTVFTALSGKVTPGGTGPFVAY